ncbi:MAG: hypothetical protein LBH43_17755 [Treponema sp.]|nr:hypothetical protein [Treponema sp.]
MQIWERWGEPFSAKYKIRDRQFWNDFWDNCQYTERQIFTALRNIHYCVNEGDYESRYISRDPGKFIQGGMIERGLSNLQNTWDIDKTLSSNQQTIYPSPEIFRDD